MDDGDEGEGKGVYVDWEDGGQQMGVRGLVVSGWFWVTVGEGVLEERESDDEVERESEAR